MADGDAPVVGMNLPALAEGFVGSEDVLAQMLGLFETQARERLAELDAALASGDAEAGRKTLHSLVNIAGAVRAYVLADLARRAGEALRGDDLPTARELAVGLRAEAALVLRQSACLLALYRQSPAALWSSPLPR